MTLSFDQIQRRTEEEKESEERKHTEEVTFLKKTNAQLKVDRHSLSVFVKFYISFIVFSRNWRGLLRQKNKIASFESKFKFKYFVYCRVIKKNYSTQKYE